MQSYRLVPVGDKIVVIVDRDDQGNIIAIDLDTKIGARVERSPLSRPHAPRRCR